MHEAGHLGKDVQKDHVVEDCKSVAIEELVWLVDGDPGDGEGYESNN